MPNSETYDSMERSSSSSFLSLSFPTLSFFHPQPLHRSFEVDFVFQLIDFRFFSAYFNCLVSSRVDLGNELCHAVTAILKLLLPSPLLVILWWHKALIHSIATPVLWLTYFPCLRMNLLLVAPNLADFFCQFSVFSVVRSSFLSIATYFHPGRKRINILWLEE